MRLGQIFSYVFGCFLIHPQKLRFTIWSSYIMICVKLQWHGFWDVQKRKSRIPIQTVCHSLKKRLNKGRFIWKKHVHLSSSQLRFFSIHSWQCLPKQFWALNQCIWAFGIVYAKVLFCYPVRHGQNLPRKRTHPRIKWCLGIQRHIWKKLPCSKHSTSVSIYLFIFIHFFQKKTKNTY